MNSKWVTGLNVNHKTRKILEDNSGGNIDDLGYDDDFSDTTTKAQSMKEKKSASCTSLKLKFLVYERHCAVRRKNRLVEYICKIYV